MSPIQSYFRWHDAMYLRRLEDPKKNRAAIKTFRQLRAFFFVVTILAFASLAAAIVLFALKPRVFPEYTIVLLSVLFGYGVLMYTWVAEAHLFRSYIHTHQKTGESLS